MPQFLRYLRRYFEWSAGDRPQPVAEAAWAWIERHVPPAPSVGLCWGDARVSNMIFDGTRCVLCGGCVDVCPTACLKLAPLSELAAAPDLAAAIEATLGPDADLADNSAILKDEDRCIRCGLCEQRCPVQAITMERVTFDTTWSIAS